MRVGGCGATRRLYPERFLKCRLVCGVGQSAIWAKAYRLDLVLYLLGQHFLAEHDHDWHLFNQVLVLDLLLG